jgi:arsenate reductase
MNEIGIDISRHTSKSLSGVPVDAFDTIVTLCAEEVCPSIPGEVRRFHWALPDPATVDDTPENRMAAFRKTRDELRRRIETFLNDELAARGGSR